MHTQRFMRIFILGILVLVALAPTGKAFADTPVVDYVTEDVTYMLEEQPCQGMEVWDHEIYTYSMTTFLNSNGSIKAIKIHIIEGVDNFYNPQNSGFVLSGNFGGNSEIDLQTGDLINVSGITAHVTFPGYGKVVMFTGHWLLYPTIHLGGLYSFDNPKDMAKFCSLLAGH